MKNIWKYISLILIGALAGTIATMKILKPGSVTNITAANYIAEYEQAVKKLKQKGDGNVAELSSTVQVDSHSNTKNIEKQPFLKRIFKTKKKES